MGQSKYLIDTNAVIDYLGRKLPKAGMDYLSHVVDDIPIVSVITKIELLGFNAPDEHYQLLLGFIDDSTVVDLTNDVVNASIDIRKNYKTKLPDAIIAATAIAFGHTLVTRNIADFKNIDGLNLINPWEL